VRYAMRPVSGRRIGPKPARRGQVHIEPFNGRVPGSPAQSGRRLAPRPAAWSDSATGGVPELSPRPKSRGHDLRLFIVSGAAILVVVVVTVVLVALGSRSNPRPPAAIARPTGLFVDRSTTTTVSFTWSGPRSGTRPQRYLIRLDGKEIGAVFGTVTSYVAKNLDPDTSYRVQVGAANGKRRSRWSSALFISTTIPVTDAGVLTGAWTEQFEVTELRKIPAITSVFFDGMKWQETWRFLPKCRSSSCSVVLYGTIPGHDASQIPLRAILTRSGRTYSGIATTRRPVAFCTVVKTVPMLDRLKIQVRVTRSGMRGGTWTGLANTGTLTIEILALRRDPGSCPAAAILATIRSAR
jgi:hypothetical protein